jgi:hypothetical protein
MNAIGVVIALKSGQLAPQIQRIPEEHAIQVFAPDRSD